MAFNLSGFKEFFTKKIRNRYRLIIRNDQNLEEKISVVLTPLNLVLIISGLMVVFATFIIMILPYTPIGYMLPGGGDVNSRNLQRLQKRLDSMEKQMHIRDQRDSLLRGILEGDTAETSFFQLEKSTSVNLSTFFPLSLSFGNNSEQDAKKPDSIHSNSDVQSAPFKGKKSVEMELGKKKALQHYVFFTPLKGLISDTFNMRTGHTAVDILSYNNAAVKATLDGTVVLSTWTSETGHVMILQHTDNLISVYKHNSTLLKKQGTVVKAGEVIALVGNSGELTSGPHLHFELWQNGRAVNPTDYILF